jgi:peptidylprolyl isomerase
MKRFIAAAVLLSTAFLLFAACNDDNGDSGGPTATPGAGGETPAASFAEACQPSDERQWTEAPDLIIDTSKKYVATIKTAKGNVIVELYSDVPVTTNNFVFLACKGYYDGVTFHRVLPDFVAQGGDPTGSGSGGPGYAIADEDDGEHMMEAGVISMAKAGPDTTGSQFFITYTAQPRLDADFTVFGQVTEGMDVLAQLTPRDPEQDPNAPPGDVMETITIEEQDAS